MSRSPAQAFSAEVGEEQLVVLRGQGDLPTANEMIANVYGARPVKGLAGPEDLYKFMGTILVHIRESTYKYERPSATICFAAAFDDEHGVGVLTDGTRVLGIGHQSDVTPFRSR